MVMSFLYYCYGSTRQMGSYIHGEKSMSVGSDGTRRMISLHYIYIYVLLAS